MSNNSLNLGIVGAGIAGLSLSIFLRRIGYDITVFERSSRISEFGAGVQLSPNGVQVLRLLGLDNEVLKSSTCAEKIMIRKGHDNKLISQIPLGSSSSKRFGAPFLQIYRPDLVKILYSKACELGVTFQFGKVAVVKSTSKDSSYISVGSTDFLFDAVAVADGIHSLTRAKFFPDIQPKFLKQVAYRATVSLDQINHSWRKPEVKILVAEGCHVVCYPLLQRSLLNLVFCCDEDVWSSDGWSNIANSSEISKRFNKFSSINGILDQLTSVHKWGLLGYENNCDWYLERLALVGDACHPMLPYLAQGANQALEDAASLSSFLAQKSSVDAHKAFALYSKSRRGRVAWVQKASQQNGRLYHLSTGPKRFLIHSFLYLVSRVCPSFLISQFDWLYSYKTPR